MTEPHRFKIDRSQRMHSGNFVVRVYQVFGTESFGWDDNREQANIDRPLHGSRAAAEQDADESLRSAGHFCDDACYAWRSLT
jgi:hypothetical protein